MLQRLGLLLVLASIAVLVSATEEKAEWINGYVPQSTPFDNPGILTDHVNSIPSAPDCSIRPQTVVEIQRMRESASRIAQMIEAEVQIMNKRKTYVEQMTAYLNDRIRELNKVKTELAEETRWIEISTTRIEELAHREKLVKMQDILACLNQDQTQLTNEAQVKTGAMNSLQQASAQINMKIQAIQAKINSINSGTTASASGVAGAPGMPGGAPPGAPGAPPAAGAPGP